MTAPIAAFSDAARNIGPVSVSPVGELEARLLAGQAVMRGGHLKVAFANAHFVNEAFKDHAFRAVLAQFLILPDGIGVDLASKLLYGKAFPANLNGTDFIPGLLRSHAAPLEVGLIGARPGVAEKAAAALAALAPQHQVRALSHGFVSGTEEAALLERLGSAPVDILLVAMGNPAQEKWIARCITPQHARVVFGVGALFDFMGGEVERAPETVRKLRLEWVWRLALEPQRLWRRYVLGNPVFLLRVLAQKLMGHRAT